MQHDALESLLRDVREGSVDVATAMGRISGVTNAAPAFQAEAVIARLDANRADRCGFPEVIYGESKEPSDLARLVRAALDASGSLLVTRADRRRFEAVLNAVPVAMYHERARCITVMPEAPTESRTGVLIACAGTSDVPVAEEARVTASMMGEAPETRYDVGVAGLQRILAELDTLRMSRVIVVVAGMDGALPSVVAGLTAAPVIAVPTSVGYGAAWQGVAPLLTMLNACAPGVSVVNIDNGFGAGYLAATINAMASAHPEHASHQSLKRAVPSE